jgi:hypothetical protein
LITWLSRKLVNRIKFPSKEQLARFIETARKLGCDEDKERFEESLAKIAAFKPPKKPKGKKAAE